MSEVTAEAARRLRENSPAVNAVCLTLETELDPELARVVGPFAALFFTKAPPELLHERTTDELARMALGAFRFLQGSSPGRVDVEVSNPDEDREGWYAPVTVIRTDISERPFVVDTIRDFLHSRDLTIVHLIYPVLNVRRDDAGAVIDVQATSGGTQRESLVHCEVSRIADASRLEVLRSELAERLELVVRATDDFGPMLGAVDTMLADLARMGARFPDLADEVQEIQAFLRWLRDGAFVFLGYRAYRLVDGPGGRRSLVVEPGSGLGILQDESRSTYAEPVPLEDLEEGLRSLLEEGPLLGISKTHTESPVHRRARMDYLGVKTLGPDGRVTGEHRLMGLFTSKAYSEEADNIPILRRKLSQILEDAGVREGSYDYKEINTIFNSMPKEELFLTSAAEIGADVRTVLTTYQTREVRVTFREDPLYRGVAIMVILPKERFSGEVRKGIEQVLVTAFEGDVLNYHLALGEGHQARLHFYLSVKPTRLAEVRPEDLEERVRELIRSWEDRVVEYLERVRPADEAHRLARAYGRALSPEYAAATAPIEGVEDILELEAMRAEGREIAVSLSNVDNEEITQLKVYLLRDRLILSDFMPILENGGLRVIDVSPFEVEGPEVGRAVIHSFAVQDSAHGRLDVEGRSTLLGQMILAVRSGDVTNDSLNALVLSAGLHWREVDVLRAYVAYAFQAGAVPSRIALPSALNEHPGIAGLLFSVFETRFDPRGFSSVDDRLRSLATLRSRFRDALSGVDSLADDRALRSLCALIDATVRTNYYRHGGRVPTRRSGGVPYVSLKISGADVPSTAKDPLLYEVWVRSARMEGIHLRGGRVARGGIRWSDRPDDFRTEVLGLVKTQMVKNAVIVPSGSKGGFVTLRGLRDPEKAAEEGREQYRTLMRGLLDLTDNLDAEGAPVPPEGVVAFDPPDPYLVVAADKGTARFSDTANDVAAEYDFWLGDAFASGGSHGYDHKAVGITARGAWESVDRHFREIGKAIEVEPFTAVGIGDMSGDVFGNGMLLSRRIRLVAAFDHRHVFVDPDPDPEASYRERERLFRMGRSSWADYDSSILSPGGLIVDRGAKEVTLSLEAKAVLGLPEDLEALDGEALVRAVLRAPAELLWNGGIGTYVKSASESHSDAGDPSNDAVRVDADELRCRVVGEGGNLGFTQRARIDYALAGGRINTDALDNSGGVSLSDREVNLKILLDPAVRAGDISVGERDRLLDEVTDAVRDLVVEDNRSQSLAVSLDQMRSREGTDDFRDLIATLEKSGALLNRGSAVLPTFEELVERREASVDELTRPELCVLLAHVKLQLKAGLLESSLPDDPAARSYMEEYFPGRAVEEVGDDGLARHRLRREIVTSQLTNDLVDLQGAAFVHRVCRDTGRTPAEVARAWLVAARLAGHEELVQRIVSEGRPLWTDVVYRWLTGLGRVLERTTRWVLANVSPERPISDVIRENLDGLGTLRARFGDIVAGEDRDTFLERVAEVTELGGDKALGEGLIALRFLDHLLEVLRIGKETRSEPAATATVYYQVADALQVSWLRRAIFTAAGDDRWEQRSAQALADDLTRAHHRLVVRIMSTGSRATVEDSPAERVREFLKGHVDRFRTLLEEIRTEEALELPALSVAVREMEALCDALVGREEGE